MKKIFIALSSLLVIVNLAIILFFYFVSKQGYLEGAPGWILLILGAPATFLALGIFSTQPPWLASILSQYLVVSLFLQLQYQGLLYLFFYRIKKLHSRAIFVTFCLITIYIFAKIMKKRILYTP